MRPRPGLPYQVITYVTHDGQAHRRQPVAVDHGINPGSALCHAVHRLLDINMLLIEPRAQDPEAPPPGQYCCEWPLTSPVDELDTAVLDNRTGAITLHLAAGARSWKHRRTANLESDHGRPS